jgi:hypothetical protein
MYLFNSAMQYFLRSKEKNDVFLFTNGNIWNKHSLKVTSVVPIIMFAPCYQVT